jgi:hypothetical protein
LRDLEINLAQDVAALFVQQPAREQGTRPDRKL